MLFPETERVLFDINPLIEVLCQLRFPTILEISAGEPVDFQNKIRGSYPIYEREEAMPLPKEVPEELSTLMTRLRPTRPTESIIHRFLTEDSERFISINSEFLALTERDYHRWEGFHRELQDVQLKLAETYKPAFYSRIGLRYQNVIDRKAINLEHEPWSSLINPSLIGLLGADDVRDGVAEIATAVSMTVDEIPGAFVKLRHGLVKHKKEGHEAYRIDSDFFVEGRKENEDVGPILACFNRLAGDLFRWAASERLTAALKPVAIRADG